MTLDDWRKTQGWTFAELGRQLGCTRQQAQRLCNGERTPDRDMLVRIARLSDRAVLPNDFHPDAVAALPGVAEVPANA